MGKLAKVLEKVNQALDMSKEARMARAKEQGFDVDNPVYHGTSKDFESFEKNKLGALTEAKSAKKAFWLTDDPITARAYAEHSARTAPVKDILDAATKAEKKGDWDLYDKKLLEAEQLEEKIYQERLLGQTIIPAHTKKDLLTVNMKGRSFDDFGVSDEINEFLDSAKRDNRDGVKFLNLDDAVGLSNKPATHVAIFEAKNIRSPNAAFDPAKKDSSNLLAGVTGATVGTSALLSDNTQAQDFTQRRASKKDQWKELRERTLGAHPLESFKYPPVIEQTIEAPKSQTLLDIASAAQKYNDFVDKPLINLIAPELPAELWRKQAYGQPTTLGERSLAALAMSPL